MKRLVSTLLALVMALGLLPLGIRASKALTMTYTPSSYYRNSTYYTNLCNVSLTGNQRTDIVNVAMSQLGYHEGNSDSQMDGSNSSGSNNYCEYNYWYWNGNHNGGSAYAWCAVFVSWCARQAQIPTSILKNSANAGCSASYFNLTYYSGSSYTPQPGDLFFASDWSHVGIVRYVDGDGFYSIEGNCSNKVMTQRRSSLSNYYFGVPNYQGSSSPTTESTLSLTNYNYPTTVTEGSAFYLTGTISSNYPLEWVYVAVVNSAGTAVTSKSLTPYTYSVNIATEIDNDIHFSWLSAGEYTYHVEATDTSGNFKVLLSRTFNVVGNSGYVPPSGGVVRGLYLDSSCYGTLSSAICDYYKGGDQTTSFTFTFYTGASIPENGVIYQYASPSGNSGMFIYFSGARICMKCAWEPNSDVAQSSYTLSPLTKYTVRCTYTRGTSTANRSITIYDANGSTLQYETFDRLSNVGSRLNVNGYVGATSSTVYTTAPCIYLLGYSLSGTTYSNGESTLITHAVDFTQYAVGTTSFTSGGITLTLNGVSVQDYYNWVTYTVNYNANNGTGAPASQTKQHDVALTLSSTKPTRDGFNFVNWNTSIDGSGTSYSSGGTYTANASATLYAQWAKKTYTVTFKDGLTGNTISTQTVQHGANATFPTPPSHTGYSFAGWSSSGENITANTTITANYTINQYTVSFKDWDGTVIDEQFVEHGAAATAPANPSRTGYTFTGWDKAFNNITANTVVTATYTINTYTVTFKDHDGTVLKTQTVNYGASATPPANPTWEGHTFTGWSGTYTNVTANQVVTAMYDVNLYSVNFYLDGELYQTQSVTYGAAIALPEVSVYGYTFSSWTLENGEPVPASMPAHDLNVYGTLIRNVFIVTYVGDYTGTEEVVYGENAVLPVLDVPGLHYVFTVNGEPWDGTNLTEDVTVTVSIEIDVYTVTFIDGVTGEILSVQQVEWYDPAEAPAAPEHYGYTFTGWDADFSCVTGDMTVTAVYAPVTFTVIFTDGLDNIISIQEVPYLSAAEEPEVPFREGWIFVGWDADFSCIETSMVVNALWEKQCCLVTFTGSYNDEICVPYGEDCPLPVYNSSSICYIFKVNGQEWCPECVKADVTVTVSVAPVKTTYHTVTFIGMNGEVISVQSVQHGQAAEAPEAPAVPGYRFIGWDRDNFGCVTYSMTRTAVYERTDDILPGDVNGDGQFNFNDISTLSMYLLGTGTLGEGAEANADYNGDGKVDFKDISDMYMAILG